MNEMNHEKEFADIINKYEDYINVLTIQIDSYKEEQEALKSEMHLLITENNTLATKVNEYMKDSINTIIPHTFSEENFLENLKLQLNLAIKEKDSLNELWQNSLKTIDYLEEELKQFENYTQNRISSRQLQTLKDDYEKQIKDFETQLQLAKKTVCEKENELCKKNEALEKSDEEQTATKRMVKKMENEMCEIKSKQKEITDMRCNLLKAITNKNKAIENFKLKENESKVKINEALQLVEAALIEKDAALQREQQMKEEMEKLTKMVSEMVDETKDKVKNEIELIETKYNIKLKKSTMDLDNLNEELKTKNEEIIKYKKDCKIMEEQLERISKGNIHLDESNTSKLLILEKNLESTFQKLLISEKTNQQLIAERNSIKNDLEQMANYYEQDVKLKEIEKITLESKVKSLQNELQKSNLNLIHLINKVNELNRTLHNMKEGVKSEIDYKDRMNKIKLSEQINQIQSVNNEIQVQLKQQLETQIEVNKKWKNEVHDITDKLQKRLIKLKSEVTTLKKQNKELKEKLNETEMKLTEYKNGLESLCTDVNNAVIS